MKTSQKGTKLNDVRYFRQPRPYTRKRITKMRVIPDLPGLHGSINTSPKEQKLLSNYSRSSEKSRDRCITLDRDQRSTEIAWISYTSDSDDSEDFFREKDNSRSRCCNTFVETDPEKEIHVYLPESGDLTSEDGESVKFGTKLEVEKEVQVELELQVEEKNTGVEEIVDNKNIGVEEIVDDKNIRVEELVDDKNIGVEKLVDKNIGGQEVEDNENIGVEELVKESKPSIAANLKLRKEPPAEIRRQVHREKPEVCSSQNSSDSKRSSWLRYGSVKKILDFFGHFLGKRETENHDKEGTKTADDRRLIKEGLNSFSNQTKSKNPDFSTKSRTKRSAKRKKMPTRKNTATKEPEDLAVSALTRQIMNTRDKRLRATLIEHEMRTRKLEEENQHYRRIFEEKLKTRQMSSPLH